MIKRIRIGAGIWVLLFSGVFFFPACGGEAGGSGSAPLPGVADPFDLDLALELGRLCLQSYQALIDFNAGKPFELPPPYTLVKQFFTSERFEGELSVGGKVPIAFVATKDENIYVVFRGTVTIIEWIDDAEFAQVSYTFVSGGGMTEQGFTTVYATINTDIINTVNDLINSGKFTTLYVTGHSLGAALAVLAAPELNDKTSLPPTFYNFAGPRVGDPKFSIQIYGSRIRTSWRVVNTNDLVPKLPEPVVVMFQNNRLRKFFYEHVNAAHDITFGKPISSPTDFTDIEANHIMCNYYNALCEMTGDPETCKKMADGADGCNA